MNVLSSKRQGFQGLIDVHGRYISPPPVGDQTLNALPNDNLGFDLSQVDWGRAAVNATYGVDIGQQNGGFATATPHFAGTGQMGELGTQHPPRFSRPLPPTHQVMTSRAYTMTILAG